MIELIAAVSAFIAVTSLALSIFVRSTHAQAVERRLGVLQSAPAEEGAVGGMLMRGMTSSLPGLRSLSSNSKWGDKAALDLQRAGLSLRVSEYLLLRLLSGSLPAMVVLLLAQASGLGFLLALVGASIGYMLPGWWVGLRKSRRLAAINAQLVEMLQLLANSLRSGFAFTQAIELASKQLTPPMQNELDHLVRDIALGARMDDALKSLAQRTGSLDIDMMVTSIMVQRTAGGNLSEILDNVANTVRERERLKGEIRALTASQRFTGLILSVYPIVLGGIFFLIAPSLMSVLFTETLGRVLLGIAVLLQLLGMYTIHRILQLDV
jgi:tight adherence protein B